VAEPNQEGDRRRSAGWVKAKYFSRPGDGAWAFRGTVTDEDGGKHPVVLFRAGSLDIRRHVKVRGEANPYDPAWELYFEERWTAQMANTLKGRGTTRYLWLGRFDVTAPHTYTCPSFEGEGPSQMTFTIQVDGVDVDGLGSTGFTTTYKVVVNCFPGF
jgi:hypothetical protein